MFCPGTSRGFSAFGQTKIGSHEDTKAQRDPGNTRKAGAHKGRPYKVPGIQFTMWSDV